MAVCVTFSLRCCDTLLNSTVPNQDNRNGRYGYEIMAAARSVQVTTINLSTVSEYMCMVRTIYWVITHVSTSRMVYFAIYVFINAKKQH